MLRAAQEKEPVPKQPTQAKIKDSLARGVPYDKSESRWKKITEAVACHIAVDQVPIYTVEKAGFINLLKVIDSHVRHHTYKDNKAAGGRDVVETT